MVNVPIVANSSARSSPWVDYTNDILYVAADDGKLYRVNTVFRGTPTLDTTAPWPKTVNANSVFTSPTLDPVTGNAFLGAGNGRVYSVNVTTPGTVTQIQIGTTGNPGAGVLDSPFIDVGSGTVFAVSSNDTTSATHGAVVVQASTSTLAEVSRVHIGLGSTGGTNVSVYDGDFDNAYFANPSTGHLLMCGTGATDTTPQGYLLGFDANSHLLPDPAPTPFPISTNASARCGPITEFYNANLAGGPYDFFFWGVTRNCVGTNGCIMSRVNGAAGPTPVQENGGTSGIIIDNNSTQGGASSIYFSSQQNPRNAVKLTQLNLN